MSQSRGRKAHFSETKFNSPNDSFIFICFQLAACISWFVQCISLAHWLLELFTQTLFFDILEIFRLDIGQSSFNLVKKGICNMTARLSSTSITFYDILAQACIEIQILKQENDLRLSRLSFLYFYNFFRFSFFTFCFLFPAVIGLLRGLLAVKKLQGKHHQDEQISPWSSHM